VAMWLRKFRVMQEAGADGGGGGGGGTGAAGSGGNDGGAAAGEGGAAAEQGTQTPAGSLLQQGQSAADAPPSPAEYIPEKYRVQKEDGTLDLEASSRKLAEAHGHLEKRL